jgi:hypothetical protein
VEIPANESVRNIPWGSPKQIVGQNGSLSNIMKAGVFLVVLHQEEELVIVSTSQRLTSESPSLSITILMSRTTGCGKLTSFFI